MQNINVNHITMNTGHNILYKNDSMIPKDLSPVIKKMVSDAKKGEIDVLEGTRLRCVVNEINRKYSATLYINIDRFSSDILIMETAGALDEKGADLLWPEMDQMYMNVFNRKSPALRPKAPFICDLMLPCTEYICWLMEMNGIKNDPKKMEKIIRWISDVEFWSAGFAMSFGIEMLKSLRK